MIQAIREFIFFLDKHSGSLTFLVTAVYVVATIVICYANFSSAKAAKEQLEESKSQYEESKRLEMMPYLHFEMCPAEKAHIFGSMLDFQMCLDITEIKKNEELQSSGRRIFIRNIGNGTARDISYTWNNMISSCDIDNLPFRILQPGENKKGSIEFYYPIDLCNLPVGSIEMRYRDLLNNCYKQRIAFLFHKKVDGIGVKYITVESPVLASKEKSND